MWGNKKEYQLIITIVDQGKGEEVIECSKLVGAEGGTILTGRGAGKACRRERPGRRGGKDPREARVRTGNDRPH